jgi:hypothetical protein
MGTEKVRS